MADIAGGRPVSSTGVFPSRSARRGTAFDWEPLCSLLFSSLFLLLWPPPMPASSLFRMPCQQETPSSTTKTSRHSNRDQRDSTWWSPGYQCIAGQARAGFNPFFVFDWQDWDRDSLDGWDELQDASKQKVEWLPHNDPKKGSGSPLLLCRDGLISPISLILCGPSLLWDPPLPLHSSRRINSGISEIPGQDGPVQCVLLASFLSESLASLSLTHAVKDAVSRLHPPTYPHTSPGEASACVRACMRASP
jgi:hypothetical protein